MATPRVGTMSAVGGGLVVVAIDVQSSQQSPVMMPHWPPPPPAAWCVLVVCHRHVSATPSERDRLIESHQPNTDYVSLLPPPPPLLMDNNHSLLRSASICQSMSPRALFPSCILASIRTYNDWGLVVSSNFEHVGQWRKEGWRISVSVLTFQHMVYLFNVLAALQHCQTIENFRLKPIFKNKISLPLYTYRKRSVRCSISWACCEIIKWHCRRH